MNSTNAKKLSGTLREMVSEQCACGAKKAKSSPFCTACTQKLPPYLRTQLQSSQITSSIAAFNESRKFLNR